MSIDDPGAMRAPRKLGLICGGGQFPLMVARGARRSGCQVVAIAIRRLTDPAVAELVDEIHWTRLPRLGQWIRILKRRAVRSAILAGSVCKADMYRHRGIRRLLEFNPDWTSLKLWYFTLKNKQPATVLAAIANTFIEKGITVEDSTKYTPQALAREGNLTVRSPSFAELRDIEFGWRIAREMSRLDIGQSIAVKEQDVIAVEAIEGTDRMIERAGGLCPSGGWCLIKVSRPQQDMRFDVPTIGPATVQLLHQQGASTLCIEAGKTLIVECDKTIDLANAHGIAIVGRSFEDLT